MHIIMHAHYSNQMDLKGQVTKRSNSCRTNVLLTQHFVPSFALGIDCSHPDLNCARVSNPYDLKDKTIGAVFNPVTAKMIDPNLPGLEQDADGHGTAVSMEWP
jgi:hypothetical protein